MLKDPVTTALDTHSDYLAGVDLSQRLPTIVETITKQTGFVVDSEIWRSRYYGSEQIGAIHYAGSWRDQPAVLKIQGAKPQISEQHMIAQFAQQNRSRIVRPPKIFWWQAWQESDQYEAFIMEQVDGAKVLQSGQLQTRESIKAFLSCYVEYRVNCLPQQPWTPAPEPTDFQETLEQAWQLADQRYPNDSRREVGDWELAQSATAILAKVYDQSSLEFMHGHFSVEDLIRQNEQVVLFSNLYWKWKYPYYDAVFGYHWYMFTLQHVPGITLEQIEQQRQVWMQELLVLPSMSDDTQHKLLNAALLERAIAGLVLDSFLVVPTHPLAPYFTQTQRNEIVSFCKKLSD